MAWTKRAYALSWRTHQWIERAHPLVVGFEVAVGAATTYELIAHQFWREAALDQMHDWADTGLFGLLLLAIVTEILARVRRERRGYLRVFAKWRKRLGSGARIDRRALAARMRALRDGGRRGIPVTRDAAQGRETEIAGTVARASARVFSLHTLGTVDPEWYAMEALYIRTWLEALPQSLWRMPLSTAHGAPCGDAFYCSVVLPIEKTSYEMVRRGHLNTLLAHPDRAACAHIEHATGEPYGDPVHLLAYAHVLAVSDDDAHTEPDADELLYTSLQHLAWMLERLYPGLRRYPDRWCASITCEATPAQDALIEAIGFSAVPAFEASHHASRPHPQLSPVGFALYGVELSPGPMHSGGDALFQLLEMVGEQLGSERALVHAPGDRPRGSSHTPGA